MRFPGRIGLWGAFWALGASGQPWPACGELDVVEHVNTDASVFGTLHFAATDGSHRQLPLEPANRLSVSGGGGGGGGPTGSFHTYRVEVGCDAVTWLVDGVPAQRVTRDAVAGAAGGGQPWPYDKRMYLLLNLAVGGTLPGADVDPSGGDMLVDWVRVWQLPAHPA